MALQFRFYTEIRDARSAGSRLHDDGTDQSGPDGGGPASMQNSGGGPPKAEEFLLKGGKISPRD